MTFLRFVCFDYPIVHLTLHRGRSTPATSLLKGARAWHLSLTMIKQGLRRVSELLRIYEGILMSIHDLPESSRRRQHTIFATQALVDALVVLSVL